MLKTPKYFFNIFMKIKILFVVYCLLIANLTLSQTIKPMKRCLCFYLNQSSYQHSFINFGIYDTAILQLPFQNSKVIEDSLSFFSPNNRIYSTLHNQITQYHLYDVPHLDFLNIYNIKQQLSRVQSSDSSKILEDIFNSTNYILDTCNFPIISWLDRRPTFASRNRISNKKGIYIKCRPINCGWYLINYSNTKNKLCDLELNINRENPEVIKLMNRSIRIWYKDSTVIAYPISNVY